MSTKAIREALDLMKMIQGFSSADIYDAALIEVVAIERAAKEAYRGGVTHRLTTSDSGLEIGLLLESISKEAP